MKKILVLGSGGMLGHMVLSYLLEKKSYSVISSSHTNKINSSAIFLDASDKNAVKNIIKSIKPNIIINCIGILIRGSEKDPPNTIYMNSFLPHYLVKLAREYDARLIHISTDCVFSGHKGNYSEDDFCDAADMYGRSKNLGEIINDKDLTIRTSIIGPELKKDGEGLFHWFMTQKGDINGYLNSYWSGVTTLELSKAIVFCVENEITGLIHLTNGEPISKYNLLFLIKNTWNKNDVCISQYNGKKSDKSLKRSVKINYVVPSYERMLSDLKEWMDSHREIYTFYYDK